MRRLLAFEHHLFASAGTRRSLGDHLFAVLTPDLPLLFEVNQLVAEAPATDLDAAELMDLSERILGAAGLTHRRIRVEAGRVARGMTAAFERAGWCSERHLAMAWCRPFDREADADRVGQVVREVSQEEYEPLETALLRQYSSSEPVVRQLLELRRRYAAAVDGRFFAAADEGRLVSGCEVWSWEGTAEIDAVGTLSDHRCKGLARAVISRAVLEASKTADLVFLFADDDDWPKNLYAKLGFDAVGLLSVFTLPPPSRVTD